MVSSLSIFIYTGSSMNAIFKDGDRLLVIPYSDRKIRKGDVIIFLPPGGGERIIHRIIAVNSEGIRTRGDNSNHEDQWILRPEQILGCVIFRQRGGKKRKVFGGPWGRLTAWIMRTIHGIDQSLSWTLGPLYRWLARSGLLRHWLPGKRKIHVFYFKRPQGIELQLHLGKRLIGRLLPGSSRWQIRRPYRLFIDEASLPRSASQLSADQKEAALKRPQGQKSIPARKSS